MVVVVVRMPVSTFIQDSLTGEGNVGYAYVKSIGTCMYLYVYAVLKL